MFLAFNHGLFANNNVLTGVVYMKNTILQHWDEKYKPANAFIIRSADKQLVRDNIIEAVLGSSNLIRYVS
jgi:Importin-beta N-terminal domain